MWREWFDPRTLVTWDIEKLSRRVVLTIPVCAPVEITLGWENVWEIAVAEMFVRSVMLLTSVPTVFFGPLKPMAR